MNDNIYVYFADFVRAAGRAKWHTTRIEAVLEDARSGDYEHAVEVLTFATIEAYGI